MVINQYLSLRAFHWLVQNNICFDWLMSKITDVIADCNQPCLYKIMIKPSLHLSTSVWQRLLVSLSLALTLCWSHCTYLLHKEFTHYSFIIVNASVEWFRVLCLNMALFTTVFHAGFSTILGHAGSLPLYCITYIERLLYH